MVHYSLVAVVFAMLSLGGCAFPSEAIDNFDRSYRLYERALRWQDYDLVLGFHKNEKDKLTEVSRKKLKKFRVSGYNVLFTTINADEKSATQVVEVKYYHQEYAVIRDITLTNKWEYDETKERWELANPFPDFR